MRRVLPPGPFAEIAGVTAEAKLDLLEYEPTNGSFDSKLARELGIRFHNSDVIFPPRTISESLTLHDAEPIATFRGGHMAGLPAITRNRWQRGWVFYVATDCAESMFFEAPAREAGAVAKLPPLLAAPYGVEVTSREDSKATYYFLLNLTEKPQRTIRLPAPMDNLITRDSGIHEVSLGPFDVAILSLRR